MNRPMDANDAGCMLPSGNSRSTVPGQTSVVEGQSERNTSGVDSVA